MDKMGTIVGKADLFAGKIRDVIKERGIIGRLMNAVQGQLDGSSVNMRSKTLMINKLSMKKRVLNKDKTHSFPRKFLTAQAPYAVKVI